MIVLNSISSVYPPTKEIAMDLTTSLTKALDKFKDYPDLLMRMTRYRDILVVNTPSLKSENDNAFEQKNDNVQKILITKNVSKADNSNDRKKKKDRSREKDRDKDKKKDEGRGNRRSPNEDSYKSSNKKK